MKYLLVFLLSLGLVACNSNVEDAGIKGYTKLVDNVEGCNVYWTYNPKGNNVTWVRCSDKQQPTIEETQHTESCGKGCTRSVTTQTIRDKK